jgi:predicted Zn-dependent protease
MRRPRRLLAVVLLLIPIGLGLGVVGACLWGEYHFRAAESALERYRLAEAREHLQVCLKVWPKSSQTRLLAARTARRLGFLEEAEQHLVVCDHYPGDFEEAIGLERVLLKVERGEVDPIRSYCRSLVERKDPSAPLVLEAMANGYMRMYRLGHVEVSLRLWLGIQPNNPQALLLRGWVREHRDNYTQAANDFRQVLKRDPENNDARLRLANALLEQARPQAAAKHLRFLHRRMPDNLTVLVNLARCRHLLGQQPAAIRLLEAALARHPRYPPALSARGQLALQTGHPAGAERWLRRAVAVAPHDYETQYLLHQTLTRLGKTAEADKVQATMKRLRVDISRIREIVTRQMSRTPHDPALHCEVGTLLLRSGAAREGLRWLDSALKEDPQYGPAHKALADYYLRIGNVGRSLRHRELAQRARSGLPAIPAGKSAREAKD